MHGDHGGAPAAGVDLGTDARQSPVPTAAPRGAHPDTRAAGSPARGVLVRVAPWALTATTVVAVAATFGPWLRTGSATRTSYEVVRAGERLEVMTAGPQSVVSAIWAFLPMVAALSILASTLHRRYLAAGSAAVVGLAVAALAAVVTRAPRSADWGAQAGLASGSALVVVALAVAWTTRSSR